MRDFKGMVGYVFVIIGALLIDSPIIALLAIPLFIAGVIILALFYDKLFTRNNKLGMLGILVILGLLAYSAVEFNQHLVLVSREESTGITVNSWMIMSGIIILNLAASYLVFIGLNPVKRKFVWHPVLKWWLPTVLVIPLVILLLQLMYTTDNWMGG